MACQDGRSTNKELYLSICGEHGGDPASEKYPIRYEIDYIRFYQKAN